MAMRTALATVVVCLPLLLLPAAGCGGGDGEGEDFDFAPLGFPLAEPAAIVRMAAFAVPDWSGTEPHNGIDLIVDEALERTPLVSPTRGTVRSIRVSENPFSDPVGQMLLDVTIRVNAEWSVHLVIEPSTVDEALKQAQRDALVVSVGQEVAPGDAIGDLLVGTLGYPHLHYMVRRADAPVCAYRHSSPGARAVFEDIQGTRPDNHLPDGNICFGDP